MKQEGVLAVDTETTGFLDRKVEASLKRGAVPGRTGGPRGFLDRKVEASLKQEGVLAVDTETTGFLDRKVEASLKAGLLELVDDAERDSSTERSRPR